jgi:hypothetical protein
MTMTRKLSLDQECDYLADESQANANARDSFQAENAALRARVAALEKAGRKALAFDVVLYNELRAALNATGASK